MLVSWDWLKQYLELNISEEEVCERLTLAGLNFDGAESVGSDRQLDLEVTSNRPDWLGHIGIAREIGVLFDLPLNIPQAAVAGNDAEKKTPVQIEIKDEEFCPRYIARVIRGAKIGPSPEWLAKRLETLGINVINNVVDVTNYVMMEIGQPLHAFDLSRLRGETITIRRATKGEKFNAIDHRTYDLLTDDYVIADAEGAVALAGVMGGADTEVQEDTTDLLIEAAEFAALPVRTTSRQLKLKSDSSYRFERGVDPEMIDWASRRCCELILQTAGGQLVGERAFAGHEAAPREPITLRLSQLPRILGIEIPLEEVRRILTQLGNLEHASDDAGITVIPPTWRRDLTREIDLVEEVARIHGYDKIPEHAGVAIAASHTSDLDRVRDRVRHGLCGMGFDETLTRSVVSATWSGQFQGWTEVLPLTASTAMVKGEDRLRVSLLPSLLGARRNNEKFNYGQIELYEIAKVYLPRQQKLPDERYMIGLTSGADFYGLKGVVETLIQSLCPDEVIQAIPYNCDMFAPGQGCLLKLDSKTLGFLGTVSDSVSKRFDLPLGSTVAELDLGVLQAAAVLVPQHQEFSTQPAMTRDLNLIVDEEITWQQLSSAAKSIGTELLEDVTFREIFRDPQRDGPGKKRILLSITLRSADRTLTGEEADSLRDQMVSACEEATGAKLLA
ncbi:MAG: phenylalanine--tRNA ligase subunit beta [Pirellulaceae bacterium]